MNNSSEFRIEASRGVVLRRLGETDLDAFQAYRQDPDVGLYQDWARMDDKEARGFLKHVASVPLFQRGKWSQIGIDLDGALIGDMGILRHADAPEAEIGITLAGPAQRKGLAEIAVRALFAYLFDELRMERIVAGAMAQNARSIALMERLGMEKTGEANGDVDYVLVRSS